MISLQKIGMAFVLFLTVFSLVSCTVGSKRANPNRSNVGDNTAMMNSYKPTKLETEVLARVNAVRATGYRCGNKYLPPVGKLQINEELSMAALRQARDMATTNFFSHAGINGNTAGDRITAAGYTWSTYGENIAAGQRTPNHAVDSWLKSPGHCLNIMNGKFHEMGVASATYKSSKFKIYWVQTFGAR